MCTIIQSYLISRLRSNHTTHIHRPENGTPTTRIVIHASHNRMVHSNTDRPPRYTDVTPKPHTSLWYTQIKEMAHTAHPHHSHTPLLSQRSGRRRPSPRRTLRVRERGERSARQVPALCAAACCVLAALTSRIIKPLVLVKHAHRLHVLITQSPRPIKKIRILAHALRLARLRNDGRAALHGPFQDDLRGRLLVLHG